MNARTYSVLSFPAWTAIAAQCIEQGQTLDEFLGHCHPDNRTNARNAYNVVKARKVKAVGMTPTAHEKSELARFARAITSNEAMRAECELFAILPDGSRVTIAAFDRVMSAYRAWLVFNTQP